MKVLVIGSGGREHALVWKLSQSPKVSKIYCAPGNAGIETLAECIDIKVNDLNALCSFAKEKEIDLTVVGPELPLVLGISDLFKQNNLHIFGPTRAASKLESSKSFAKNLMIQNGIPTPQFNVFENKLKAMEFIKNSQLPVVIKFDGLANGKGVYICETVKQAQKILTLCFQNGHKSVVIEEFMRGQEVSFQVVTDGYTAIPLPPSQDYKRAFEGNGGANTGGMGSYSPVNFIDADLQEKIMTRIIQPVLKAMDKQGAPFSGLLYAGLMIDNFNNPYVIEFNSRFGDPETQTIMPLLDEDLFDILYSTINGALGDDYVRFKTNDNYSVSVVLVSGGYPGNFNKGFPIKGLENTDISNIFHSGTAKNTEGQLITANGRVITVNAVSSTLHRAYENAYDDVAQISFSNMRFRKDIARAYLDEKI